MNTTVALCRIAILLLVIACVSWIADGQLYQRRVCPTVRNIKSWRKCKNVPDRCSSDEDCPDGGERCCPTESQCYLSCQKTVIPTGCPIPIDLALLLDSSGSIGRRNWKKVQKFAKEVVDIYDISEKGTHIAIMPYSTKPVIEIKFNKYKGAQLNGVNIKRDIDGFRLQRGLTFIDRALDKATNELFTEEAGMRKDIRKVALVLTDGIQTKNRGPYTDLIFASQPLKDKGIDIYSLGVGSDIDVLELIQTASVPDFVFSANSFDDLSKKVTEITDAQCKACDKVVDVVFGIPDSTTIPKPTFNQIKRFFIKLSSLFKLSPTKAHYGVIRYSDSADMAVRLDQYYNLNQIQSFIKKMTQQGSGVDVNQALRSAADHVFTIFGGVRQTVPKTFVIFIPQPETVDQDLIKAMTEKLKSMGVRIMFVGLQEKIDTPFYGQLSSQPSARYLLTGFDIKELTEVATYEAVDTICKARYGKCPIGEPPAECPEGDPDNTECKIDDDCSSGDSMCCYDVCGSSQCIKRIKNCFVTMDVALAIDSSAAVNDADFKRVQAFTKNLVHHFADSENSIHFGVLQYGASAQTIVDFNKYVSDPKIKQVIDGLVKGSDDTRRVDLALQRVKKDIFSLEGGMRQGHPRFVIFITGGDTDPSSASLAKASEELRGLGVNILAIGINSGVSKSFLNNLATDPRFVYSLAGVDELSKIRPSIENEICKEKPGKCPPTDITIPTPSCYSEGQQIIHCGVSADKPGGKSSDWDCPGEQKCCIGADGCAICTEPPNECRGQYDLTLVMENSASISPKNFQKMKDFAKELVSAFFISELGTRVASVTYGDSALVNFKLNTVPGVNRKIVYSEIDKLPYKGGSGSGVAKALEQAVQSIYTQEGGTRDLNNKSLVIMGTGKFLSAKRAALMANKLRQEQVDVFLVPIGGEGDVPGVRNVVSKKIENNAFMTTSFDALRPHLRALTKAICDGAEKLKPCKLPLDVVFGIPTSGSLGGQFGEIKDIFNGLLKFFAVNNRLAHFGVIQYSNDAAMTLKIDSTYNRDTLAKYIGNLRPAGNRFNVEAAFKRAADHAFTIFGGVRQTVPKTFVIFVPREASTPIQNVLAAAQNLKRMGVKVIVLGLSDVPQLEQYRQLAVSQPSSKFFFGDTMDDISGSIYNIRETICKGRYGRCPPEPNEKCTNVAESCELDMDCGQPSQMCCAEPGCQRSCTTKLDNCFVNMEIAIAIDNSQDGAGGELNQVKQFVNNLIRPLTTSENSMRLSLMTFGAQSETLARFRELNPESVIQQKVAAITQSGGPGRDLNNAFTAMRMDHFSLEGGMRQGHPRLAIFVVGADAPNNFVDAANELKSMDRMRVMAIGTKQSVSDALLSAIASEPSLVFKANSPADLNSLQSQVKKAYCQPKPGKCPPAPDAPGTGCPATVPARFIPCKNSDWPCPGEQKCCRHPSGCFDVCAVAPRACAGVHDLALLLETNDEVGPTGFNKVKNFAKQLIDGFSIADSGTRVAVISYGDKANVDLRFNTIINSNKERIKARIDRIPFRGGGPSLTSQALQEAFTQVYKFDAGSRGPSVNKSLLIISQGKYQDPKRASRFASQLQQQGVDVYQMAIGGNEDIPAIRGVASKKQHKTVFMTSSYDSLRPHLRAVTNRICEGAEKPYICKKPLDLIFGIPVAKELGGNLGAIKTFLTSFTKRFIIGNRGTHIGMILYSGKATLDKRIDEMYNPREIDDYINRLTHRGNGFNLTKALATAADYGFNIYGGTRPNAPKAYIIIVPGAIPPSDEAAIRATARKLKSLGVRLVVFGLSGGPDKRFLRRVSSQPSRKYLTYGNFDDFIASTEKKARTICRGRYGTCNENPPPPPDCPDPPLIKCEDDSDCADPDQACCETACAGSTQCAVKVKNCFVNMEIALAVDTSDGATLPAIKEFAKKFVTAIADTENAIHFSVMGYADTPTTMSTLGEFLSKQQTNKAIDALSVGAGEPRVDLAMGELRKAHFSLEGGVRQGHPRFALFITSKGNSPSSGDLAAPTQALSDIDVNIAAVGANGEVASFVDSLASNSKWAYKVNSPAELQGLIPGMKRSLCPEKPGKCPPVAATCPSPGGDVPQKFIPCGESAGKSGRSDKENDWDCPGEQRCCKDPTGCHQICRGPPNECPGTHDLAFLVDSSNDVGEENFELSKKFVNDIVDAFKIGSRDTRIALITYGAKAKVEMTFNKYLTPNKERVKSGISRARYIGNGPASTAAALQQAVDVVFNEGNGAREGVNKSLVIISPGKFTNPAGAIRLAGLLKLNQVDVFAVPIGKNPDIATIRKVISKHESKNAFMTTTYLALRPHVRGLTKTICEGAEKIKICDRKMDVVFGIPTAKELGGDFQKVKDFYKNMLQLFKVNNRKVHVGLIPYSSSARLSVNLDQIYNRDTLMERVQNLKPLGNGYNVRDALRVAADHAFTMFGGTRPSAPKTFVLFVPGTVSGNGDEIQAAAAKLKSIGVRLMVMAVKDKNSYDLFSTATSQPAKKHYIYGDYDLIGASVYDAVETICKAKYGKCPAYQKQFPECPDDEVDECALDGDCGGPEEVCCEGSCGKKLCAPRVRNCFVAMDIGIAVDASSTIPDAEFNAAKKFVTQIIHASADSENNIHYGLLKYGLTPQLLANFRQFESDAKFKKMITDMKKTGDADRRLDYALQGIKSDIFSLNGGMRQGRPRYAIVVVSGPNSAESGDLKEASKLLRALGVKIIAVGSNGNVDNALLEQVASDSALVFKATGPDDYNAIWNNIQNIMCSKKPGTCPPVAATCSAPGSDVPAQFIPCGESEGKSGKTDKENDWDCPGTTRCCKDPSGCHSICREPPNVCKGQHDLTILMDNSANSGREGFQKIKTFAQGLVDAFDVGNSDTKVAVISYDDNAKINFRFNSPSTTSKGAAKSAIQNVPYLGGSKADVSKALKLALQKVYKLESGMRPNSNKSLVIIGSGKFANPTRAARFAGELKLNLVDIFAMPIGYDPDIPAVEKVASPLVDNNIFMTTSPEALKPHLRALTKRICEGAEKPKVCDKPMDIVYGIPTAVSLGDGLKEVKSFFKSMTSQFTVSNRKTHIGLIPYSDSARLALNIDAQYSPNAILSAIENIKKEGSGLNVARAIQVAADHAFTVYGGTRPTAPKTFVLYVPGPAVGNANAISAAAKKLKSVGVKLMVVGLEGVDKDLYKLASSQPHQKYFLNGNYDVVHSEISGAVDTICKGKYGKCPAYKPPKEKDCGDSPVHECDVDGDCADPDQACCEGNCGRTCNGRVKNCFVAMDIAIALDATSTIPDQDFENQKRIATHIVNSIADAENSIHYGLLKYAGTSQVLANFNRMASDAVIKQDIKNMRKTGESERRIDTALATISSGIFSLEGGMRQGHPRNVIFFTSGSSATGSDDLVKSSKGLRDLGVRITAIGVGNADESFLKQLAGDGGTAIKISQPDEVDTVWSRVQESLCPPKPNVCPPVSQSCNSPGGEVPLEYIPCGDSAGKGGRSQKENDWDCPGEQKCCRDPSGCHSICRPSPNYCANLSHDLAILLERSDATTEHGFEKAKAFAQDLADAFYVADRGTHVSVATFGPTAEVQFRFNYLQGPQMNNGNVRKSIGRIQYAGGSTAAASGALNLAVNDIFTDRSGAREGVNKSLVIVGSGQFLDTARAIALSAALKQNLVDVFSVPIGPNYDVATQRKFASPNANKNVFITSSYDALRPHVRAVTKAICDGAIKIRKCDRPVDVYFGIPNANFLAPQFGNIRRSFVNLLRQLVVSNRLLHVGIMQYSDSASVLINLDRTYNRDALEGVISREMGLYGSGLNLAELFNKAADHGFTIYGGTRQTAPKVLVVFIPGPVSSSPEEIRRAADKLKGLGVRLVILGLNNAIDKALYSTIVTQPASKYLLTADTYNGLSLALSAAQNRICNAKYGRCPKTPEPPAECPDDAEDECSQDRDCKTPGDLCCKGGCSRTCQKGVENCFVPMDIAFALDVSETTTSDQLKEMKEFVRETMRSFASAENDIHFSLMQYAGSPQQLTQGFRRFPSEGDLLNVLNNVKATGDPRRRVDLALASAKRNIFSLEGRMRHGHPRYLIFVTSAVTSADSTDLPQARSPLDSINVKTIAIGANKDVQTDFLKQLASENSLVFQADSPDQLSNIRQQITSRFCDKKPGKCVPPSVPPDPAVCASQPKVPLQFIPCGDSLKGKEGRSQRENDWDCPGESKCCKDPDTGCHNVCRYPPIVCNKVKDLELVVEASQFIGEGAFARIKQFLQYFVEAFGVSRDGTHVGMITYGSRNREAFRLNAYRDIKGVKDGIKNARFMGGFPYPSEALVTALDVSFTRRGGARPENVNKSLVLFTTGKFEKPEKAAAVAFQLKEKLIDVYAVAIGDNPEIDNLRNVVSRPLEDNIFMVSSPEALRAQARALVKRVCDGGIHRKVDGENIIRSPFIPATVLAIYGYRTSKYGY